MSLFVRWLIWSLLLIAQSTPAKIIVVNTTNNVSPAPTETNLVQAINLLQDGDEIRFNIPGPGPFYLVTPPLAPDNGYSAITKNNVIIDGYTQPGASPNTNPILASNNARISIVLDSRAGGGHIEDIPGYSDHEAATLFVKGATNVTIRGLCFLGAGKGHSAPADPDNYAISFASGASFGHVNGCWLGVALDRTNVYRFTAGITGFEGPGEILINKTVIGVEKNAANPQAARAQFNVIVGHLIPIILEGEGHRIAGNFINVFPDGMTDYNSYGPEPHDVQALIEIGRQCDNLLLGTDGDGVNDAEERNIFGGVSVADDGQILEWYGDSRTNMVIAGNYFGIAVDGVTRFANSMKLFGGFNSSSTVRIGSDFDGVSDDVEGNLIAMNYPFDDLFPDPSHSVPPKFADLQTGARVSLRGNRMVGNNIAPFSYADGSGDLLDDFTNYFAPFISSNQVLPVLSTNSSVWRISGSCGLGVSPYTNIVIDVYLADEEGWTNGMKFELSELAYIDPTTSETKYYGFAQGRTFMGSFADNGPWDSDATPGQFNFDISALKVSASSLVTVAANYSDQAPGVHNGRVQTSTFAMPVRLQPAPRLNIVKDASGPIIFYPTNNGFFSIEKTLSLGSAWTHENGLYLIIGTNYWHRVSNTNKSTFYRLIP